MAKYDFSLIPRGVPQKLYPNFVRYAHKYLIENSHLVKELIAQVDCTPSKGFSSFSYFYSFANYSRAHSFLLYCILR